MITVGIDEVGRGCWAGPLVAGSVVLLSPIPGLRDSKKLSKTRREVLAAEIEQQALAIGLGWVQPDEVDGLGLTKSVELAMRRAYEVMTGVMLGSAFRIEEIIIDGNINYFPDISRARAVVRADGTVPAVSAASIVAKVARDRYMSTTAAPLYPEYGFEKHVGYGTARHIEALRAHGITPLHRKSYQPIQQFMLHSGT